MNAKPDSEIDKESSARFLEAYSDIEFELINWNTKLKELCPQLMFHIDRSSNVEQKLLLEYWAIKYICMSERYIYINPYIKQLKAHQLRISSAVVIMLVAKTDS